MEFKVISPNTQDYDLMVALRYDILRKPIGLTFTKEHLDSEKNYKHLGIFQFEKIIACCILVPLQNNTFQLKQMAVAVEKQSQGVGAILLAKTEELIFINGKGKIVLNARQTALGFYNKCGYQVVSDMFEEVGIPHFKMEKEIK